MILRDLSRLRLKLLQPVHLVVKKLLDGVRIDPLQLIKNTEDHIEAILGLVGLLEHAGELVHADLTVSVLALAVGQQFAQVILVLPESNHEILCVFVGQRRTGH